MLSGIFSLFLFIGGSFFSAAQEINSPVELAGTYQALGGDSDQEFKYLSCEGGEIIEVTPDGDDLHLDGIIGPKYPLTFDRINLKTIGTAAPILNYNQRRTKTDKTLGGHLRITKQFRACVGLVGDIGCLGSSWRTTTWLESVPYGEGQIMLLVGYRPFAQVAEEVCAMVKKN